MDQGVSVRDEESSLSENGDTTFDRTDETDEIKDIKKEKLEKNISENSRKGKRDLKTSMRAGEQQTKVVNENIEKVENHFPHIVQDINLYTVRSAKLRDAGDNFAKSLQDYAVSETPVLRQGLSAFAECFASVQDHRNVLVNRLENKVVQAFSVYETKCKQAKLDVKQHTVAHSKELNQHKSFERVKTKSTQQFQLAKAEAKYKKAAEEANRSAQILDDQVSDFERQKTRDLKKVFGEFMLSEMLFYAKALEIYTRAYQELMEVDEEENVEQLRQSMKWAPHQFANQIPQNSMYTSAPTLMQPSNTQQAGSSASNQSLERTM
ncbi:CBY1-interacting BAR domain-containing protein 1-like isoform X1 [Hydractinia symbiolongicarpus]|uniref:CBY1-interacting BAR domain-containing protein 1-like isoform X1 n=1 Tax=Hydractinia symbiolongicarpus TaxID=13093 RepID=UPI00254DD2D0|nr:CBY1-interacting BAR domain-containing protein 1-like isoform X1 [Hydractinia symbiolongicarpus]